MIPLLEARRLSALFCGHKVKQTNYNPDRWYFFDRRGNLLGEWSPDTNAEQMAECMDAVRKAGYAMLFDYYEADDHLVMTKSIVAEKSRDINLVCPWRHFPMYAAAELQRRKE